MIGGQNDKLIVSSYTQWHTGVVVKFLFDQFIKLSPGATLRSRKRRHKIFNTPSKCNLGIEDIRHFLLECPFYAIQRVTLAVNVIDILQKKNLSHLGNQPELYLYGHHSLDLIDNRQILQSTIKYVKETTRFSTSVT